MPYLTINKLECRPCKTEAKNAVAHRLVLPLLHIVLWLLICMICNRNALYNKVLQILNISDTDENLLRKLFDKTVFNDVKELDYSSLRDY